MTPEFLKLLIRVDLSGLDTVLSLIRANVGCPAFVLASTMNLPMYPVAPMIRILLFSAIEDYGLKFHKWDDVME